MMIQPYLFFEGRCEEAAQFYAEALGAEVVMLMRFKEAPESTQGMPPGAGDKIMHMSLKIGDAVVMASDGRCSGTPSFAGVSLSLTAEAPEEADRLFAALAEGGQVQMPITTTFFAPRFGMVADRFGVSWMVLAAA